MAPGTAGTRGPVPKRSTERRRRNKESAPDVVKIAAPPVKVPPACDGWHELAREWYESLAESGQSKFFEPSDWAAARILAEVMSRNLKQQKKFSAVLFASVWSGMSDLLTTEGERRRVRMEIERQTGEPEPESQRVVAMKDYRKRLGG